jgi:hypothetical protein
MGAIDASMRIFTCHAPDAHAAGVDEDDIRTEEFAGDQDLYNSRLT